MNNNFIQGFKISWNNVPKDSYVRNIKAINKLDEFLFESPITFFVGENGSGKSTLLEAIAENYGFNKEGGTRNYRFSTFDEISNLTDALILYKGFRKADYNYFFRAETFFNVASMEVEYSKYGNVKSEEYHNESHGEGFLHLFKKISNSRGIFLLDEPEAALSYQRQLSLFSLIYEAAKSGSQFIIVTHSPILLAIPNAEIFAFNDEGVTKCKYEDTDSYKVVSNFINHKDIMVEELIK